MRLVGAIKAAVANSFKAKLSLFLVVLLGLTIGVAPWCAIRLQEHQLRELSHSHLIAVRELLEKVVAASMLARNRDDIQQVIEALGRHEDVGRVRVLDTEGVIHFSAHPEELGRHVAGAELYAQDARGNLGMLNERDPAGDYTLVQPMRNETACHACHDPSRPVLGMLQVSLSADRARRQMAVLSRLAFGATVIALGGMVAGLWFGLSRLIDRPLGQLVQAMARAKQGDLGTRVATHSTDELGRVARHFNEMLSQLQFAQEAIERHRKEQMARADRLATIGEMATIVAHEIRNPITGIVGVISVLSRELASDDPRVRVVRETQHLIERLNKTVNDLEDYARPSPPDIKPVLLDHLIDRSLSVVDAAARQGAITIVRESSVPEKPEGTPRRVHVDPRQIQQALVNLILNAIQASPAGGQIRIRTGLSAEHGDPSWARIEIEDDGHGMSADQTARAFSPFFTTKTQGTGLGLAIARQIVEQHGGRVALFSRYEEGTQVRVELPWPGLPEWQEQTG